MKPVIKAIWFDDEHKDWKDFIDICKNKNIIITPFEDRISGVKYLKENFEEYDVVILDGWFKKDLESMYDDTGAEAIEVNNVVKQLKKSPPLEVFVFTARKKDKLFTASFGKNRIYIKSSQELELINDIIDHCNNLPSFKLKHEHQEVFELFDQHLSDIEKEALVEILLAKSTEFKSYINVLRILLDGVLKKLIKNEHLPSGFLRGEKVNFKSCERFINEQAVDEVMIEKPFEERVKTPFNTILQPILHPGSHSKDFLKKNNYLIKGTAFFLMDLLLNLAPYIKSKAKRKNWKKVDRETGSLKFYNPDGEYGIIENTKYPKGGIWFSKRACSFGDDEFEKLTKGAPLSYIPRLNKSKGKYEAIDVRFFEEEDPDQENDLEHKQ